MAGRKVAISNCARALNDNEIYIIQIFDNAPSGLLVKAYLQAKSLEYFMPITEGELEKAALNRGEAALTRLAESIDLVEKGGAIFLESSIPGIAKPKVVPSGARRRAASAARARGRRRTPQATACASSSAARARATGRCRPSWPRPSPSCAGTSPRASKRSSGSASGCSSTTRTSRRSTSRRTGRRPPSRRPRRELGGGGCPGVGSGRATRDLEFFLLW